MRKIFLFLTMSILSANSFAQNSNAVLSVSDCNKLNIESTLVGDDGYIVVVSDNTIQFAPVNGTTYPYQNFFGIGDDFSPFADGEHIVYNGQQNAFVENLNNDQNYYYGVYYYTMVNGAPSYSAASNQFGQIDIPSEIELETIVEPISCEGSADGYFKSNLITGTSGFTYSLSSIPLTFIAPTETEVYFDALPAGSFTFEASDANGCKKTVDFEILEPSATTVDLLSLTDVTCSNTGQAEFFANVDALSGNILSYSVELVGTNASSATLDPISDGSFSIDNLQAGDYEVIVRQDQNPDCFTSEFFKIESSEPIAIAGSTVTASDCAVNNGSISLSISGGSGSYSVVWFDEEENIIGSEMSVEDLAAGNYSAVVHDVHNCSATKNFVVEVDESNCWTESKIAKVFSPNNDAKNDYWTLAGIEAKFPNNRVTVCNRWGEVVFQKMACGSNCWDGKDFNSNQALPVGTYFYVIETDVNDDNMIKGAINLIR